MKLLIGFVIGLALGFGVAILVGGRGGGGEEAMWAGDDRFPQAAPQSDGMAAAPPAATG